MKQKRKSGVWGWAATALLLLLLGLAVGQTLKARRTEAHTSLGFAMSTVISQTAYGTSAEKGMQQVESRLAQLEEELSLFKDSSEIAKINASAGLQPQSVNRETFLLLQQALKLSAVSDGFFQITVAPLTQLWGITTENPHVPSSEELEATLPLIQDSDVVLDEQAQTVYLPRAGQAIDLGGIAKGYACDEIRKTLLQSGVESAVVSIGGNVCAVGTQPNGTPFRIGFRDPAGTEQSYIASFELTDEVVAVSGGYERWFEENGKKYHHILDPHTGYPAESDIVSVGVVSPNGAVADFWSTTLFCWGKERTLEWMKTAEEEILLLDDQGTLYVSSGLREGFRNEVGDGLTVVFVEAQNESST